MTSVIINGTAYYWNQRVWYLDSSDNLRKARIKSININEQVEVNLNIRDDVSLGRVTYRSDDDYSSDEEYNLQETDTESDEDDDYDTE